VAHAFTVRQVDRQQAAGLVGLPQLLIDVVDGGASVGFLAPLSPQVAAKYWDDVFAELGAHLHLFVAEADGTVVGSVQLAPSPKQNGRHRAEVQKLIVLRAWRGRGVASRLLGEAEGLARSLGRTLLVLDTEADSVAESVYKRLGWQWAGGIPDYAASTAGSLRANTIFYKRV
jgi:GNAT superfamily N-acetyltransferase